MKETGSGHQTPFDWDETFDVVVIGAGFAGLAAAIEAKLAGASVIVLEKMKAPGGNSIISGGGLAAAGTKAQQQAGIVDSPELMIQDMAKAGLGLNHPELVRTVCEKSAEVFQWTVDYLGVEYLDRIDRLGGQSAPRVHTTLNHRGTPIIRKQLGKLDEMGIELRTGAYLERLPARDDGTVCGAEVRQGYNFPDPESGTTCRIAASKAVILATGGFAADVAFRLTQDPRLTGEIDTTNKKSATAEGLVEALRLGAMPVQLSWIQLGPWTSPDELGYGSGSDFGSYVIYPHGIAIDPATGNRYVNELADRRTRVDSILRLGHPCVGIADSHGAQAGGFDVTPCLRKGVVRAFDGLPELATAFGIDADALSRTVERFNRAIENGIDPDFGKTILPGAAPLDHPPYYAMRLWPKVHYTMGGIRIDDRARVIDLSGRPIPGLYAAGEVTGGVHGASRLGGFAITECLAFGRIAGQNAAAEGSSQ